MTLRTNADFLERYIASAPAALAFERVMECRILAELPFERPVLDIGCGEGLFASILFGERVDTGVDPARRELERARELGAYAELIACAGSEIPKPDGAYRTIFCNSVLEHIPCVEPVLREAHRLLAPEGRLYVTVPSHRFHEYTWIGEVLGRLRLRAPQRWFYGFFNRFWSHYHCYEPRAWAAVLQGCGFDVVDVRTYGPRRVCLMNDALTMLSIPAFLTKRLFNRWTLFPGPRRAVFAQVAPLVRRILSGAEHCPDGGLVFLVARKPR